MRWSEREKGKGVKSGERKDEIVSQEKSYSVLAIVKYYHITNTLFPTVFKSNY